MLDQAHTDAVKTLRDGGVVVVRTDTIYGIIALASNEAAVEKVYAAKHRDASKQCIVLIDAVSDESPYAQKINEFSGNALLPTSVVVPATDEPSWLLRGGTSIAYRVVRDPFLRAVVQAVGPVIAPSANPEGVTPAATIDEARAYFGDTVDLYIDGGTTGSNAHASEIVKINNDATIEIIRSKFRHNTQGDTLIINKHHSAGGLLFKDNNVLLIHWDAPRDTYDFPKGHLDAGESSEIAAVREVYEETGYKTRVREYIDSNGYYFQTQKGEWRYKTVDYYLLESVDGIEHEVARELHETFVNVWVPVADAPTVITKPMNVAIFNKALQLLQRDA